MKRKQARRFVKNRRTGEIAVQSTPGHIAPLSAIGPGTAFDAAGLLDALIEVEEMLSPAFAQERVPPELTIAFLADAMYTLLTGESEIPSRKLRVTLCQFILAAWSSGRFTPSPAFPYSFEQVFNDAEVPAEEGEDGLDDAQIAAAHTLAASLSRKEQLVASRTIEIDRVRDALFFRGTRALRWKQYARAEDLLRQAVRLDLRDESEACYYLALTRVRQRDLAEGSQLFVQDHGDRDAPLSWLLGEWCSLCASSSRAAYLAAIADDMEEEADPLAYKEEEFDLDYGTEEDDAFQGLAAAIFAYLHGDYQLCLTMLEGFEADTLDIADWAASFWNALALAAMGQYEEADGWLRQAIVEDIPLPFLLPLRWYERSHPSFYQRTVRPLFTEHDLWPLVAACDEGEQEARRSRRARIQWRVDQVNASLPGFSQVSRALDALRETSPAAFQQGRPTCRSFTHPRGIEIASEYARLHLPLYAGDDELPVFLAEIPASPASHPVKALVAALLEQLGDPLARIRDSEMQKRSRLVQRLRARQVEMIILTHMENLAAATLADTIEWLCRLFADDIGSVSLLLVGTRSTIEQVGASHAEFGSFLSELDISPLA
jgi:tetratricopeptide (TPR) repeat protein